MVSHFPFLLQGPDAASAAVARHVRSPAAGSGDSASMWPADLLQSLVATCYRALRALPTAASNLLATVTALAAASPTAVRVSFIYSCDEEIRLA